MTSDLIPDDVRELVVKSIDSVAQLEVLLFLRRLTGGGLDASSLAERLFASKEEMKAALARLQREGFIKEEHGLFRYDGSAALTNKVDRLAASYRQHLIPITNLIHSKPSVAKAFSDAFKLRKE